MGWLSDLLNGNDPSAQGLPPFLNVDNSGAPGGMPSGVPANIPASAPAPPQTVAYNSNPPAPPAASPVDQVFQKISTRADAITKANQPTRATMLASFVAPLVQAFAASMMTPRHIGWGNNPN